MLEFELESMAQLTLETGSMFTWECPEFVL